jgi:ParB family chromosome partitioning protein
MTIAPEYKTIAIEFVSVPDGRREVRKGAVDNLATSLARIGLKTPITVRHFKDLDDYELVAGLHRLRAAQKLGWDEIPCWVLTDEPDDQARLWEIAENLHRAELTALERNDLIAEWIRIAEAQPKEAAPESVVLAQIEPKPIGRPEGGIRKAARELGIDRSEAQRAVKSATLSTPARRAAHRFGLQNNKTVLLKAASAGGSADQVVFLKAENERRQVARNQHFEVECKKRTAAKDKATEELVASLTQRYSAAEIGTLISWLEIVSPFAVIDALRKAAP